jgi:hypothetical protein
MGVAPAPVYELAGAAPALPVTAALTLVNEPVTPMISRSAPSASMKKPHGFMLTLPPSTSRQAPVYNHREQSRPNRTFNILCQVSHVGCAYTIHSGGVLPNHTTHARICRIHRISALRHNDHIIQASREVRRHSERYDLDSA